MGFGDVIKQNTTSTKSKGFGSVIGGTSPSGDTKTTSGLFAIAAQNGLGADAKRIVAKNQGETKKIFSGGVVSDFFDVLNALDYGVVGMLKGKTFLEGVESRQSFASKDALGKYGISGTILGTALDIAVDPLTYIGLGPVAKTISSVSKATGLTKLGQLAKTATFGKMVPKVIQGTGKTVDVLEGGIKPAKFLADKLSYMFGKDPIYRKVWERAEKNIGVGQTAIKQFSKGILNLPSDKAAQLLTRDETGRFIRKGIEQLTNFTPQEINNVKNAYAYLDDLGKQAVDLGLLTKGKWEENVGEYLKATYKTYEEGKKGGIFGFLTKKVAGIKSRKNLSPEELKALGQIDNPAYLYFKSTSDLIKDIENTKFFNEVADKFGGKVAQDGFTLIKEGRKTLGNLAGKYVPDAIYKDIAELTKPASDISKWLDPITGNFKFFKVVMNPASHVRNVMSNKLLNNFDEAGMPLWRLDKDMQGWRSVIKKDKWYQEVEKLGGAVDTFTAQELGSILTPPAGVVGKAAQGWNKTKEFLGDLYQREEMSAKMSMYIFQRTTKKLAPEEAWKIAERATFNYAQVTPFIRKMRSNLFGMPFITFTVKSTPVIAKTALKNPTKISNIGKIRNSIESMADIKETERERASEPSWVKNGFYVKLPMKDKQGRSAYFDLTYILPFGDLVNLGDETQLNIFSKSPALNFIKEIGNNKDFYGNKIWRDSDSQSTQAADLMRHVMKTYLPPLVADQIPGGYSQTTGIQTPGKFISSFGATPENQKRNLQQEIARMAGMKIQPIDADIQETYQDWNTKKDLQTLLQERGLLKEFSTMYQPKK